MDRALSRAWLGGVLALMLSACASLPEKTDIPVGAERFRYALQGSGSPAVVFEAGLGGGMDTWVPVYEKVATFTTAFAYDRRGYGESGEPVDAPKSVEGAEVARMAGETALDAVVPGASTVVGLGTLAARLGDETLPRTGAAVVADLHALLKAAGVLPPYVLVGHSLGGLYVSLYARTYPGEIAGVVLLDSMHPEQFERCQDYLPAAECDPEHYPWWTKLLIKMTPAVIKAEVSGATETGWEIRTAGPLPPVLVVVISHGEPPPDEPGMGQMWAALQEELVRESPHATHLIARKSGHNIQSDQPELVVQAIKDVVLRTRPR